MTTAGAVVSIDGSRLTEVTDGADVSDWVDGSVSGDGGGDTLANAGAVSVLECGTDMVQPCQSKMLDADSTPVWTCRAFVAVGRLGGAPETISALLVSALSHGDVFWFEAQLE